MAMTHYPKYYDAISLECFSSWVQRVTVFNENHALLACDVQDIFSLCCRNEYFDPDYSHSSSFFVGCMEKLNTLGAKNIPNFLPGSRWIVPYYYRRAFCYECLCEHVQLFRYPTCLQAWGVAYHTVCEKHGIAFSYAPESRVPTLERAMGMFRAYHDGSIVRLSSCYHGQSMADIIPRALHAQRLFLSLERQKDLQAFGFVQLLMRILLYPRFGLVHQKIASRMSYPSGRNLRHSLHYGALVANVQQRQLASVMTCMVLDAESGLCGRDWLSHINELYPHQVNIEDIEHLGRLASVFVGALIPGLLSQLDRYQQSMHNAAVDAFVTGFKIQAHRSM